MDKQSDDVFATRTLKVDGAPCFHLRIFKPFPEDNGAYWRCRYVIGGPLTRHSGSQCGIDGMQALLHVMYILGVEAELSEENGTRRLSWDGQSKHFGFPPGDADPGRAEIIRLAQQGQLEYGVPPRVGMGNSTYATNRSIWSRSRYQPPTMGRNHGVPE